MCWFKSLLCGMALEGWVVYQEQMCAGETKMFSIITVKDIKSKETWSE